VILHVFVYRYGVELIYKKQPLIRARGVSYCKNLLSPRFEHSEGKARHFFL
jgi:endoribonuclease Dicer